MKIAIIGKGRAGTAIADGLRHKHEIKFGHRDPAEPVVAAARWGEIIILAVPYGATKSVVKEIGSAADGKTLIDITNPLTENMELAVGSTTSAAEETQKMLPKARVVKAFNSVFPRIKALAESAMRNLPSSWLATMHRLSGRLCNLELTSGLSPLMLAP